MEVRGLNRPPFVVGAVRFPVPCTVSIFGWTVVCLPRGRPSPLAGRCSGSVRSFCAALFHSLGDRIYGVRTVFFRVWWGISSLESLASFLAGHCGVGRFHSFVYIHGSAWFNIIHCDRGEYSMYGLCLSVYHVSGGLRGTILGL